MKTLKVLTMVAITGLTGMTAVYANPIMGGEHRKMCKGMQEKRTHMKDIFKQLDLTAEQKVALRSQRKDMKKQMQAKRGQKRAERGMTGMSQFVSAKGFDKQAFMDMAMKRSQNKIAMRANMFENRINILTEEQRVKLVTLLQEKRK